MVIDGELFRVSASRSARYASTGPSMVIDGELIALRFASERLRPRFNGAVDGDRRRAQNGQSQKTIGAMTASTGPSMVIDGELSLRAGPAASPRTPASTGPSMVIDGERSLRPSLHPGVVASTGPSMVIDGEVDPNRIAAGLLRASTGPSMVIDGEESESARRGRLGRCASTGPSMVIDGEAVHRPADRPLERCFNGAVDGDRRRDIQANMTAIAAT